MKRKYIISGVGKKPEVTICMATYNGAGYLRQQIDSILAQSYEHWELLVRDDKSTDDTRDVLRDYAAVYPDKIRLIEDNGQHLGVNLNFAKLLESADSDYIMFSDQDDVWLPKKIELTLDAMRQAERQYPQTAILVHTDLRVVDCDLNTIAESLWDYQRLSPDIANNANRIMAHNVVTGCTTMLNRTARAVSLPVPEQAVMYDWWIAINVAKAGKIAHISTPSVLYRQHLANECGAKCARAINIVNFLKKLCHVRKRLSAQYAMVTKANPKAGYWAMVFNKALIKVSQQL